MHETADATGSFDSNDANYHRYDINDTWMCDISTPGCTMDAVFNAVEMWSVPGYINPPQGKVMLPNAAHFATMGILGELSNPITHLSDRSTYRIYNFTQSGHEYHPGSVEHRIHMGERRILNSRFEIETVKSIYLSTTGAGIGNSPMFNNFVGRQLFGWTHIKSQSYLQQQLRGPG